MRLKIIVSTLVIVLFASLTIVLKNNSYAAGGQLLMDRVNSEQSQTLNVPYRTNTITYNYSTTSAIVTFSSCPDQACTWAIDDAAKLTITRSNGSVVTRDFISDTQDKPAANVTDMFLVGQNSVKIELIDRFKPLRGLPKPLYLAESSVSQPLPTPKMPAKQLPANKKFTNHPYVSYSKDPVNTLTGSFTYKHVDVEIKGRGPAILFSRSYSSDDTLTGPLGQGWTHSYNIQLVRPDETSNDIVLIGPEGRGDRFVFNSGNYTAPVGINISLVKDSDGTFTVTHKDLTTWSFDETGKLIRITDRYGNLSTLTYDTNERLVNVGDPAGRGSHTINYNTQGKIDNITDWANRIVRFGYDASGRLSTITDRENKVTTYGYDGTTNRIATIKDARNNMFITNAYDAQGRVATQKDVKGLITGQQTTFTYNTNADNTKTTIVTYPKTSAEPTWNFIEEDTYDTQGRIIKKVTKPISNSAMWITQEYTYDGKGNVASLKDGLGNVTSYCYDVDYAGAAISGSRGNLTRVIAPAPTTGGNKLVTLNKYDNKNNLIQTVAPKGVTSISTIDCVANLSASINSNFATDYAYDTQSQTKLISATKRYTDPDSGAKTSVTKYEYTDTANPGLITKIINPRGNIGASPDYTYATTNTYFGSGNKAGMLESVTLPTGDVTKYDYDSVGRKISMTDPKGNASGGVPAEHTWQYVYDNEDRILFTKAPAPVAGLAQLVTETRYDAVGNKTSVIDANSQVTRYVYDERDSLKEVHQSPSAWTDPSANPADMILTAYEYDNLGNLTRTIRAKGNSANERIVDYTFDGLNRVVKETQYPNWPATTPTLVTTYTYDKNSNRTSLKDPLVKTTIYSYDALNRLTKITYNSSTTPNVTYSYDANGNRTKMVDGTGTTNYTYDELDRMLSVQSPGPKTIGYRYDPDGNRTKLIYPDNTTVTYAFDKANRMTSLIDWANRTTSYEYNIDGSLKRTNNLNGTYTLMNYDNAGRLKQVWNKYGENTITQHAYTMDAVGNRTKADEVPSNGGYSPTPITPDHQGTVNYTYDRLYRLIGENRNLPFPEDKEILEYTYDPVGNRLTKKQTQAPFSPDIDNYTYDKADRIKTIRGENEETFTTDANGNITKRGFWGDQTHVWDQANRLKKVDNFRYTYDGDGKRTKVEDTSSIIFVKVLSTYVYDASVDLPVILQENNQKFVYGLGLAYTFDSSDPNSPLIYHSDGLGSVRSITDNRSSSSIRMQMYQNYEAFGIEGYSNRGVTQPFMFTGEQKDDRSSVFDTGYYYLRARYYDPQIGRFMSKDSVKGYVKMPQTLNPYSYVTNNPVNFTDPSGEDAISICGTVNLGLAVFGTISPCFVWSWDKDFGSQVGLSSSIGWGSSTGLATGVGIQLSYTNAKNFYEIEGQDVFMGGSAFLGGFDYSQDRDNPNIKTYSASFAPGPDISSPFLPYEAHGGITDTRTIPLLKF